MTHSPDQLRLLYLSGTVSIPPRFPDTAKIAFEQGPDRKKPMIVATQQLSPKLVIKRTFFARDVSSIFIPADMEDVDFENGTWYEGEALKNKVFDSLGKSAIDGIIYVHESAQSILEMQTGLTAAESAEYYPPLPDDRSVNHYNMSPKYAGDAAGCN